VTGAVRVTSDQGLLKAGFDADGVRWTSGVPLTEGSSIRVRIRYRHDPVAAKIERLAGDTVRVRFDVPQRAVAPGQAAVFYRGDEVLGGAWIDRAVDDPCIRKTDLSDAPEASMRCE
jgi:tRNA-specific 2-thiouridylase